MTKNQNSFQCKFIIIPNHEHDIVYEKWAPDFPQFLDLNTRAGLCEKIQSAANKIYNEAIVMRNDFLKRERRQQIHKIKKGRHKGI